MKRSEGAVVKFVFILFFAPALVAGTITIPQTGLVGYWGGNGNANDYSGNGHDGSFWGTPTYVSGVNGQAFYFNNDSGVQISGSPSTWDIGKDFSFAYWVNFARGNDPGNNYFLTMLAQDDGPGQHNNKWFVWWQNDSIYMVSGNVSGNYAVGLGGAQLKLNQWQHLAVTRIGNTMSFYKDGVLVSSQTTSMPYTNPNAYLSIGFAEKDGRFSRFSMTGAMDDVVFYDRGLSVANVQALAGVPEPATLLLLGLGGIIARRSWRN